MIVTTTPTIEGKQIYQYLGVVCGLDDYTIGGLIGEGLLKGDELFYNCYKRAEEKMMKKAVDLGADAIVGVHFTALDMDTPSKRMYLTLMGTAVKAVDEAFDELPEL